jgi:hypothetical protein
MAELPATTQLFLSRPLRSCGLNAFMLVPWPLCTFCTSLYPSVLNCNSVAFLSTTVCVDESEHPELAVADV